MELPGFIRFASDATLVGLWGGAFLLVAIWALAADRLRARRKHIDRVGCMPWTPIFLASAFVGVGLMVVAVKGWLGG